MRLTKKGHACVRLEHGDVTLVVDPGKLSETDALDGANAVLVTHEHFDHFDRDGVLAAARADPELRVWTNATVAEQLRDLGDRVHTVTHGDRLDVDGLDVHVYGQHHAASHMPPVANVGFLVGGAVFHPGDALTVPEDAVDTLLVPTSGPWLKSVELLDFVDRVRPRRAYSIHDGIVNDTGLMVVDGIMSALSRDAEGADPGRESRRIPVGEHVELS